MAEKYDGKPISKPAARFRLVDTSNTQVTKEPDKKPTLSKQQTDMLEFIGELETDITAGRIASLIVVLVFDDGCQAEVSITEETDYSVLGRLHVAAGNVQDSITYGDMSADDEN